MLCVDVFATSTSSAKLDITLPALDFPSECCKVLAKYYFDWMHFLLELKLLAL